MKSSSMTNGSEPNREIQQEKQRRANAQARLMRAATAAANKKARQDKLTPKPLRTKNAIKVRR